MNRGDRDATCGERANDLRDIRVKWKRPYGPYRVGDTCRMATEVAADYVRMDLVEVVRDD